ncbi:HEAT repeat domain-containing protein [Phormidium sp. LEGE 05292]|uniref:HEAT repeat domain-containing protein n=1 Tax=[Phormidium] sp. LEGE 05292 TaxID=767427 RepID=UPI00187E17F1|nr:HEAT repeat domain-containing protein [Phormidium sp. LEGE 05292]MBE9229757.1 HEAT repeat domain-containing protein [Phormidium sp. LEGE 05292]
MMPSRLALVLFSCTSCFSFVAGATIASAAPRFPLETIQVQNNAPNPGEKSVPVELLQNLEGTKPSPTPKPKTKSGKKSSKWPLFWMGSGVFLVIIAGGLLYILKHWEVPPEVSETETSESEVEENQPEPIAEIVENNEVTVYEPASVIEIQEIKPIEVQEIKPTQADKNGHANHLLTAVEDEPKLEPNLEPKLEAKSVITDSNLEVQETTRLPKINIVDELIKDLQNPDPAKRRKAIWELAQRGDSRAIQPLVNSLIDADSKQRCLILEAISQIGHRTLKPLQRGLVISLQDENAEVRKNAIRDVTRIYELMAQISHLLRHAIDDPDAEVQETAKWAMTQMNRMRGVSSVDNFPSFTNQGNSWDKPPN